MSFNNLIKKAVDTLATVPKTIEETCHLHAEIINFDRSVQLDGYSCGAQCTYAILRYWDKALALDKILSRLDTENKRYTSQTSMFNLFRKKGLSISERKKAKIKDIREAIDDYEAPFLITVDDEEHWCVVYGYSREKIFVMDPLPVFSSTSVAWSKDDFRRRWDRWGAIIYKS